MPFPNEHACRLEDPGQFKRFRRANCDQRSGGKCIDVIYGIISAGKSKIQALRYPKRTWTAEAARSHCRGRGGSFEAASDGEGADIENNPLVMDANKRAEQLEECKSCRLIKP